MLVTVSPFTTHRLSLYTSYHIPTFVNYCTDYNNIVLVLENKLLDLFVGYFILDSMLLNFLLISNFNNHLEYCLLAY